MKIINGLIIKKMLSRNVSAVILIELIFLIPVLVYADQATGSVVLSVKYQNGDLASTNPMKLEVYQDSGQIPYQSIENVDTNPYTISTLPLGHSYKIKVLENSMHVGYGIIKLDTVKQNLDVTIPNNVGLSFHVYYNDGKTPIVGATVSLKSYDGIEWGHSISDNNGQAPTMWVATSSNYSEYYSASVIVGPHVHYIVTPLIPGSPSSQKVDIVTNWPPLVENLITFQVYKSPTTLVDSSDGNLGIELRDIQNNKVLRSPINQRGEAYLSNMKVGDYFLFVVNDPSDSTGGYKEIISEKISIVGSEHNFKIFINNPELNGPEINCGCVAFRLDDVQDFYLNSVQKEIIKQFQDRNASLTLGIIGQPFGKDQQLVGYIKSLVGRQGYPVTEPAIHSWDHQDMTKLGKDAQFKEVNDTATNIKQIFGIKPQTFIPPLNHFNNDTLDVLRAVDITHISYHVHTSEPPPFTKSTLYHFPATSSTSSIELQGVTPWRDVDGNKIFEEIKQAIPYYGYAVVNMHPYEFSNYTGLYTDYPNATQIQQLDLLIDKVKAAGYRIVPIEDIDKTVQSSVQNPLPKSTVNQTVPNCNCIAFRLDFVSDRYLNNVDLAIIKLFKDKGVGLTAGVVGREIGQNAKVVLALKERAGNNNLPLKLANRGWDNLDHTQYDQEIQSASIKKTEDKIAGMVGTKPLIFIPPFNKFDNSTIAALQENDIRYISSSVALDPGPYNLQDAVPFHIPQTAMVTDLLFDDPFYKGTINDKALAKIKISNNHNGFSVATIRAQDFAVKDGDVYKNQVDTQSLQSLESLIDFLKSSGIKIVTIDKIPAEANSQKFPSWVKNMYSYYESGAISPDEMRNAIDYLITQNIVRNN